MSIRGVLFSITAFYVLTSQFHQLTGAGVVGVNYGLKGNNLPPPSAVISLLKSRGIGRVRLFEPNADVLQALRGSAVEVVVGTLNEDLPKLAADPTFARAWVQANVVPYAPTLRFRYITAANEVIPGELAGYVLPAIKNLDAAVKAAGFVVPVTTVVPTSVLGSSYPPSAGSFANQEVMGPIASFLAANGYPLLVNAYPYFAYADNTNSISLDYALFNSKAVVVTDGAYGYTNLFDAIVDAVYAALEKAGAPNVEVVVSETGWPSGGKNDGFSTVANAQTYNNNLVAHVSGGSGTPRRPGKSIETYIFAVFNENQKPEGTEQNFGLYYPNMQEVYHVNL